MIGLKASVFDTLGGSLGEVAFHAGAAATAPGHRIIYNPATGELLYDENGNAAGGDAPIAKLEKGLDLDSADFIVVA